eukprot:gnl/TRDRNA2_/TRDRNA2_197275_c0_seq1.p1 gnl/TRDRNA2_/TRDRNA2_197275_c0~~gnl/TRDRNA2_/TRDRNA2_197275_c0_seq1.p1  ORF type:complete len:292 (-),score=50.36 gnl/TRDRNA2_/TRDRNA2_197275_c0_seq1:18-854(-)
MPTAPSQQTICICAATAAVVVVTAYLLWPRRARLSKEDALLGLGRLREEFAAAYADVAAVVSACGPPPAPPLPPDAKETAPKEDTNTERLRQALEQPLVLEAALRGASQRVAAELVPGGCGKDFEAELRNYEDEEEVSRATEDFRAMHQACLQGKTRLLPGLAASGPWKPEEALEMLRRLGRARVERLQMLLTSVGGPPGANDEARRLGGLFVSACGQVEDEVWEKHYPGDTARRCLFGPALASFTEDRGFCVRRLNVEAELDALARKAGCGAATPSM